MNIRQLKKAANAPKQRRIEIDGQVWYIDLPSAPVHALGRSVALKRGKRRVKAKARVAKHRIVVTCKKAFKNPWDVEAYKRELEAKKWRDKWLPEFIDVSKAKAVMRRVIPGLVQVQPLFRNIESIPVMQIRDAFLPKAILESDVKRPLYYQNSAKDKPEQPTA